ncbi:M23 family metallopeptidase [Streptomyces sp. NPDC050659]|uniref:M23 family metallopeptidase n=1 Tax=Streptomyces sp. NPDC050659 TaxID=3157215 RepID=UPI0034378923
MRRRVMPSGLLGLLLAVLPLPTAAGDGWPVGVRPLVVRGWEPPATEYGRGHRGVDLAAPPGAPVRAAAAGTVAFAGRVAGRGVVSVNLSGTGDPPLRTTYEPVRATVKKGDEVPAGALLGTLELPTGHCRPESCLHWGLRRGTTYVNPLTLLPPWLLGRGPSRLLPVAELPPPALWAGVPQGGTGAHNAPLPGTDKQGLSPALPAGPWQPPLR